MVNCSRRKFCPCRDRKSTRLNSSHRCISYAVFCLKKKTTNFINQPQSLGVAALHFFRGVGSGSSGMAPARGAIRLEFLQVSLVHGNDLPGALRGQVSAACVLLDLPLVFL